MNDFENGEEIPKVKPRKFTEAQKQHILVKVLLREPLTPEEAKAVKHSGKRRIMNAAKIWIYSEGIFKDFL